MESQFDITPYLIIFGFGLACGFWLGWRWARSGMVKIKEEVVAALRQELAEWALE